MSERRSLLYSNKAAPDFSERLRYSPAHCAVASDRRTTDIFCLFLFVAFIVGFVIASILALSNGDPSRLYLPSDYMGRVCGVDNTHVANGVISLPRYKSCARDLMSAECIARVKALNLKADLTSRPYIWYMDLTKPITYGGVCVSSCPKADSCPPELTTSVNEYGIKYCSHKRLDDNTTYPASSDVSLITKAIDYDNVFYRCVPHSQLLNGTDIINQELNSVTAVINRLWSDVYRGWRVLLITFTFTTAAAFAYLILLRCIAGPMVWISLIGCLFALVALGGFGIYQATVEHNDSIVANDTTATLFLIGGIVIEVIAAFYLLFLLCNFKRIQRAIGIVQETTKAIAALPTSLVLPLPILVILVAFYAYWVVVALYMWSTGSVSLDPTVSNFVITYNWSETYKGLFLYHLFGFYWLTQFLLAFIYTAIAGAVGAWYWSRDKENIGTFPVGSSVLRTLVYHMGSIAFGSMLVALVQLVRFLVRRAINAARRASGDNVLVRLVACFANCFLQCIESLVRFFTQAAYIQVAVYGTPFLTSARNATSLLARNAGQLVVVEWIGHAVLFLGKTVVAASSCMFAWLLINNTDLVVDGSDSFQTSPFLILLIVLIMAYLLGSLFTTVFETGIDTVLQCFLMDKEMSESGHSEPFCTSSLSHFIEANKTAELKGNNSIFCCW